MLAASVLLGIFIIACIVEFGHIRPSARKQAKKGTAFLNKEG